MLLDTHSLIWLLQGGEQFGEDARARLAGAEGIRYSSISIAEIRIKQMLGKLTVPADLTERIVAAGVVPASYPPAAADELVRWPTLVRHDPFDRLLLSHAIALGVDLLTADRVLLDLERAPVIDARR